MTFISKDAIISASGAKVSLFKFVFRTAKLDFSPFHAFKTCMY